MTQSKHPMPGQIRIIGGLWRGRKLPVAKVAGLRPSPNRLKETLFNWISNDLPQSCCLDLCCGSGSLGIEAASRGASRVTLVDSDPQVARQMEKNIRTLKSNSLYFIKQDVESYLSRNPSRMDIIFIDPPFHKGLLKPIVELIDTQGWVANGSLIYIETETDLKMDKVNIPTDWKLHREKVSGQVRASLFRKEHKIPDL